MESPFDRLYCRKNFPSLRVPLASVGTAARCFLCVSSTDCKRLAESPAKGLDKACRLGGIASSTLPIMTHSNWHRQGAIDTGIFIYLINIRLNINFRSALQCHLISLCSLAQHCHLFCGLCRQVALIHFYLFILSLKLEARNILQYFRSFHVGFTPFWHKSYLRKS